MNLSAGVHHSYIHTPMTYEPGWERGYTKAVKEVSTKPVLLVGRITHPAIAEEILAAGEADAILLARQLFADARVGGKAREGQRGGHPPLRRGQLLLAKRHPRRPRAVRLQPRGRARAAWGRGR